MNEIDKINCKMLNHETGNCAPCSKLCSSIDNELCISLKLAYALGEKTGIMYCIEKAKNVFQSKEETKND